MGSPLVHLLLQIEVAAWCPAEQTSQSSWHSWVHGSCSDGGGPGSEQAPALEGWLSAGDLSLQPLSVSLTPAGLLPRSDV